MSGARLASVSAELELSLLKVMLHLRTFGSIGAAQAESLRGRVRAALLGAESTGDATILLEKLLRRYTKKIAALDGTLDAKRDAKRRRLEKTKKSALVDTEAGEGEESDLAAEEGEEDDQ